jgi:tRNA A64-2'-O-ribosylphosphate transferase
MSLKRLNLPLLEVLHRFGGCFLVDSSVRKVLPDSFSRTIPIWCCVLNRIVQRYRVELGEVDALDVEWDVELHTPACIVSEEEHEQISQLIDSRVELLYQSKAIVEPRRLAQLVIKPLRAVWIANGSFQNDTEIASSTKKDQYLTIICCNPSTYKEGGKNHVQWIDNKCKGITSSTEHGYYYTPGAADDDATWGRRLSPELFWTNPQLFLVPPLTDDDVDGLIDSLVQQHQSDSIFSDDLHSRHHNMNKIGHLNLWIGSRTAGRPPDCWDNFDAILNATENEYPAILDSISELHTKSQRSCFYLQLPVAEGKRDKTELERWMPVGLTYLILHMQQGRRVLVHCAQGKDRSVGVVLAFVAIVCPLGYPLRLSEEFDSFDVGSLHATNEGDGKSEIGMHFQSGLSTSLVNSLLKEDGRDLFLQWTHQHSNSTTLEPLANKDSLRIVLQLISQDRENAEPTRATMQKLNRFFMSSSLYRTIE